MKITLTTDFDEVDSIIHEVMTGITNCNSEYLTQTVHNFKKKFGKYMHKAKTLT